MIEREKQIYKRYRGNEPDRYVDILSDERPARDGLKELQEFPLLSQSFDHADQDERRDQSPVTPLVENGKAVLFHRMIKAPAGQEQKDVNAAEPDVVEKDLDPLKSRNMKKQKGFIADVVYEYPHRSEAHYLLPVFAYSLKKSQSGIITVRHPYSSSKAPV